MDDWDAVDESLPPKTTGSAAKDSWDADAAPDEWDAPVKNGTTGAKQPASTKNATSANSKTAASGAAKQKSANSDKALEKARIELGKARDIADFISSGGQGEFELLQPTRKEEFDLLLQMILDKLSLCKSSKEFNPFIESLFRKVANELDTKTLKAINISLAIIAKDREVAEKAQKEKSAAAAATVPADAAAPKPAAAKKTMKGRANIKVGSVYDSYGQDDAYEDDDDDEFASRAKAVSAPKAAPAATGGYYDDEGFI